ncbi:hypothetical protein [Rhizobium leguminosarum]|uniref:hypothetical protein n=1 Tax=Rhizobium leguminosarum TaxID=384 RepID=UPI00143F62E5|nr:hypothetical protein [Rhizobium leguminosarum]NKL24910.1 hypothetical protein [Rhizobium leguminosarum bv. viciae]NKL60119.1 hypothetical protein [Rhizobium leguminosarum bv. viciae]
MVSLLFAGIKMSSFIAGYLMLKLLTQGVSSVPKTGRILIGTVAGFKSEWWPVSGRIGGRLHVGIRIAIALANKMARTIWAFAENEDCRDSAQVVAA